MCTIAAAAVVALAATVTAGASVCPGGTTLVDTFVLGDGSDWTACEDLSRPDGSIALVPGTGAVEWFGKTHEQYGSAPKGSDDDYYLHMTKAAATADPRDVLGSQLLNTTAVTTGLTWQAVADVVPPIRRAGVRAFVGSRGSAVDTTFNDDGEDAAGYGFPPARSFVFNLTSIAEGFGPIPDGTRTLWPNGTACNVKTSCPHRAPDCACKLAVYINASLMAEGLVGGHLPIVVFYFPVVEDSAYLRSTGRGAGSRYWTMVASPAPDMHGSREQTVMFRFQQISCAGAKMAPPCEMVGRSQYWDTYWWSNAPGGGQTSLTGPVNSTKAGSFYATLLENRRWWAAELEAEGMMQLRLPSPGTTNGTRLNEQMRHQIMMGMITWHATWGPRYGVLPGYGIQMQNGFEDTFTATAMGALEAGALPYARGFIDHFWNNYVRDDGLINYRAEEVAQQARMLTIFALYHSYTGGTDDALLLAHFERAKAMADWLIARRTASLQYTPDDPRHGILGGQDEGDNFKTQYKHIQPLSHFYSANAETYRAFAELGPVWVAIGASANRPDVVAHGKELLKLPPLLYRDLHLSLNKTANMTQSPGHVCYPNRADGVGTFIGCNFRTYPEMFYSGALTAEQTDAMYVSGQGLTTCEVGRWLNMGSPNAGGGGGLTFVHIPQGMPFGLLVHDMVERFLLYFFSMSAHSATRGTWLTPESQSIDRDRGGWPYASPGQANVAMAMKWMLCFEEPETKTLWLGKAVPRDWLAAGEEPLAASNLTTRYGRISYGLAVDAAAAEYTVTASVTLPASFAAAATGPAGGIRLRIRAPVEHAGKLSSVTVGGKAWRDFSAAEETIDIAAEKLTPELIRNGLPRIVATFAGPKVPLRPAGIRKGFHP